MKTISNKFISQAFKEHNRGAVSQFDIREEFFRIYNQTKDNQTFDKKVIDSFFHQRRAITREEFEQLLRDGGYPADHIRDYWRAE